MAARGSALANVDAELTARQVDSASFDGDPRLGRDLRLAWPRLRNAAASTIREAFVARTDAVRGLRHAAAGSDDLDAVDLDAIGAIEVGIVVPWHAGPEVPLVFPLAGFTGERAGGLVRYWSNDDQERRGQPPLVDAGAIIWVNDRSDASVEAALILARERFGPAVSVFGGAAYLAQCGRVSQQLGIDLEVISVKEAKRRARAGETDRHRTRRQAVERLTGGDALRRRRAWARAYAQATPEALEEGNPPGPPQQVRDVMSHDTIPLARAIDQSDERQAGGADTSKRLRLPILERLTGQDGGR